MYSSRRSWFHSSSTARRRMSALSIVSSVRSRSGRSRDVDAQVALEDVLALQFSGVTGEGHRPPAEDVHVVGDRQRLGGVLLDEEQRRTGGGHAFQELEDLVHDDRRKAHGHLVEE